MRWPQNGPGVRISLPPPCENNPNTFSNLLEFGFFARDYFGIRVPFYINNERTKLIISDNKIIRK